MNNLVNAFEVIKPNVNQNSFDLYISLAIKESALKMAGEDYNEIELVSNIIKLTLVKGAHSPALLSDVFYNEHSSFLNPEAEIIKNLVSLIVDELNIAETLMKISDIWSCLSSIIDDKENVLKQIIKEQKWTKYVYLEEYLLKES